MSNCSQIIVVHHGRPGLVAGILGCVFGVLGIFTIGLIFVPLAAVCSVIGLLRGLGRFGLPGFAVSIIGAVLTVVGAVTSPTILLLLGISLASTDSRPAKQDTNSLISCGSAGCVPVDDSDAAKAAAAAANERNRREAEKIGTQR